MMMNRKQEFIANAEDFADDVCYCSIIQIYCFTEFYFFLVFTSL